MESETIKPDTFGGRLLIAVREAGGPVSHKGAAEWLKKQHGIDISGPQITKYKKQNQKPRMEQCCAYALALNVTVEWLYTGRPPMRPMAPLSRGEEELIRSIRAVPDDRYDSVLREITGYLKVQGAAGTKPVAPTARALAASAPSKRRQRNR